MEIEMKVVVFEGENQIIKNKNFEKERIIRQ
jgi:hypothetical protein